MTFWNFIDYCCAQGFWGELAANTIVVVVSLWVISTFMIPFNVAAIKREVKAINKTLSENKEADGT